MASKIVCYAGEEFLMAKKRTEYGESRTASSLNSLGLNYPHKIIHIYLVLPSNTARKKGLRFKNNTVTLYLLYLAYTVYFNIT